MGMSGHAGDRAMEVLPGDVEGSCSCEMGPGARAAHVDFVPLGWVWASSARSRGDGNRGVRPRSLSDAPSEAPRRVTTRRQTRAVLASAAVMALASSAQSNGRYPGANQLFVDPHDATHM